jgi:nucleotidyltransferase substrate binding protein (TIGR01987 family)
LLSEINNFVFKDTIAIIREGFIQRFEVAFDLAWKTLRDFLVFEGIAVQPTPRAVIKEAFSADMLSNGQTFIEMLDARNLMSHTYDEETFNTVFLQIQQNFYPALEALRVFLEEKR